MKRVLMIAALLSATLAAKAATAADTYVFVHGWHPGGQDFSSENNRSWSNYYWSKLLPGSVAVGWNTKDNWRVSGVAQAKIVFDARCLRSASQSCTVICHSTGCPVTEATLDIHGTVNGVPKYRINRVLALGSAEGGTELASAATYYDAFIRGLTLGTYSGPVTGSVKYLTTSYARGAYDHNDTAGSIVYHVAGYNGELYSFAIAGQDDGIVPFHSACGYTKVFDSTQCSNDWMWATKCTWGVCYPVQRTVSRWANHTRVDYCGRDGCDNTHMGLINAKFIDLAPLANP